MFPLYIMVQTVVCNYRVALLYNGIQVCTSVCGITGSASTWRWGVMGSILGPNRVIAKDVKSWTYCCYARCATLRVWVGGMPWLQTSVNNYHEQLGLKEKGRAIKRLVVCNNWVLEPLDLLIIQALGCYQPSLKVLNVSFKSNTQCFIVWKHIISWFIN